jgi:hypothetical protein
MPTNADLAAQVDDSDSVTIWIDIPGLDAAGAAAYASGNPAMDVEWDYVRLQWAVQYVVIALNTSP